MYCHMYEKLQTVFGLVTRYSGHSELATTTTTTTTTTTITTNGSHSLHFNNIQLSISVCCLHLSSGNGF
jgi:hypothetical protein